MHKTSILLLAIFALSFISSSDAQSRSELRKRIGNANSKIHRVQHKLNQAHADCSKFKSSLDHMVPMSDSYEFVIYDKNNNILGTTTSLSFVNFEGAAKFDIRPRAVIPSDHVVFFSDADYKGFLVSLPIGEYSADAIKLRPRSISSVKVPAGMNVLLFGRDKFESEYLFVTESVSNLVNKGFNDKTISVKIIPSYQRDKNSLVSLFDNTNYEGFSQDFTQSQFKLNYFKSIKIHPDYQLEIYSQADSKLLLVISKDETNVYFKPWDRPEIYGKLVKGKTPVLELFSDIKYEGAKTVITEFQGTFVTQRFEPSSVSSLKISDGYEVQLFEHANFTGYNAVVSGHVQDLRAYAFNDIVKSYIIRPKSDVVDMVQVTNYEGHVQFLPVGTHQCSSHQKAFDWCNALLYINTGLEIPTNLKMVATNEGYLWSNTFELTRDWMSRHKFTQVVISYK
jgi:hypothetical protein